MRQNEHYKCGGHMEGYFIARKMRLILREMVKAQKRGDATGFYDAVDLAHDVFAKYGNFDREFWTGEDE
ncbi:MAG: hypothetical protein IPH54_23550 [Rhodoferax sp.]|nr:hypothetical protein [Rhodoferax sp.]